MASRTLQSLLYNVQPMDALTLVVAPGVILTAALIAGYIPAFRASRIDPSVVLRSE